VPKIDDSIQWPGYVVIVSTVLAFVAMAGEYVSLPASSQMSSPTFQPATPPLLNRVISPPALKLQAGPDLVFSALLAFFMAFGTNAETGKPWIISTSQVYI
jgi:hypothetical protein